jgi:hypothetical protein
MKSKCPTTAEIIDGMDKLTIFAAQQMVNGIYRAYGAEAVKEAQEEIDRRRAKESKK